jgi:hypothetical protein
MSSYSYTAARLMHMLWWNPGLPKSLPSAENATIGTALQLQKELLQNLSDYDQLELLLYLMGIYAREERGFSVDYLEIGLRATLEDIRRSNRALSEEERLEFMHLVFGGRDGLFARNDPAAMQQLSFIVTKVLINGMSEESRSENTHAKIDAVVSAIFGSRDLPVFYKVQLLNSVYLWLVKVDEQGVANKNRAVAELVETVFASLGGVVNTAPKPTVFTGGAPGRKRTFHALTSSAEAF